MTSNKYQKIVVSGCLIKDDRVLLIKRASTEEFLPGYYELPGGKCDFGEDPIQSLKREFQEEVNLVIEVIRPFRSFAYISDEGNRHTVEIVYLVTMSSEQDIMLSADHSEYEWLGLNDLDLYQISLEIKKSIKDGFSSL